MTAKPTDVGSHVASGACFHPQGVPIAVNGKAASNGHVQPQAAQPKPHPLALRRRTLGQLGALTEQPPPRQWLLKRRDDETNGMAAPIGVLQLAKVALLIAAGGVGKTIALIQLAIAVATGRKWLDYFEVASPGRVFMALGEEDEDEVKRRFHAVAQAMRLTPEQVSLANENIVVLPLAGVPVALVESDGKATVTTETLTELHRQLSEAEYRLVILDPLSRFAGPDWSCPVLADRFDCLNQFAALVSNSIGET